MESVTAKFLNQFQSYSIGKYHGLLYCYFESHHIFIKTSKWYWFAQNQMIYHDFCFKIYMMYLYDIYLYTVILMPCVCSLLYL